MQPRAYLMIDQPKSSFRFMKYYLGYGNNVIGTHKNCQVVIPLTQHSSLPDFLANVNITQELLILQPLSGEVYTSSNLPQLKNKKVKLTRNLQYVLPMEEFFYFGTYKAVVQMPELKELLQIGKIQNKNRFITQLQTQIQQAQNIEVASDKTEQIPDQQQWMFAPTLVIDDNVCSYDPNIIMQYHPQLQNQKVDSLDNHENFSISQQMLLQKIKKGQVEGHQQQVMQELSMPDTIVEGMPNTIIDEQADAPSIVQKNVVYDPPNQNKLKFSKTINYEKKDSQQPKMYNSDKNIQVKPEQTNKQIEDFMDLFGVQQPVLNTHIASVSSNGLQHYSNKTEQMQNQQNPQTCKMVQKTQQNLITKNNRQQQKNKQTQQIPQKVENQKQLKIASVSNFKPKPLHRAQLKKRGYRLAEQPNQEYDILIVGMSMKLTQRLMIGLMHGKRVVSERWLNDESSSMQGSIQGYSWQMIKKNMGHVGQILSGRFYLFGELLQEYGDVLRCAGGTLITNIKDLKWNQIVNVVLRVDDKLHLEFYNSKKKYSKWKFYEYPMIIESVLMGQPIMQKYRINDYSF